MIEQKFEVTLLTTIGIGPDAVEWAVLDFLFGNGYIDSEMQIVERTISPCHRDKDYHLEVSGNALPKLPLDF